MQSGLNHLTSEAIFPFKLLYKDICDPKTIIDPLQYNHHYLFQQFFLTLNDKNELDIPKALTPFQTHKKQVLQYLKDLNQYEADFLNPNSVEINSQVYYRKKLQYIAKRIQQQMYYKEQEILDVLKNNLVDVADQYVSLQFEPFYIAKFNLIDDLEFFMEESRLFAESEMSLNKDYFKAEMCAVKQVVFQLIDYYTGKPLSQTDSYAYQGDAITYEVKNELLRFFKTYYSLNTNKFRCFQTDDDRKALFTHIMKLILSDYELGKILQEDPRKAKNFGTIQIANIYDPTQEDSPGEIVARDIYLLEFPHRINDLDLDKLGKIRGKNLHFSVDFLKFLNLEVPDEIKRLQDSEDLPKNLDPNEYPHILYTMYVDMRGVGIIEPDFSKDLIPILRLMLRQIKERFFDEENDNDQNPGQNLIADRPKIRANLPAVVRYLKLKLGINDDENESDEDNVPDELIVDMIEEYGGDEAVEDYFVHYNKVGSNKAIKKATAKKIATTFNKLDLDEEIFSPYKNKSEDDPVSTKPMIDDENDNELPQVTEVKNKLKSTINKLIPKNTHNIDPNRVSFFSEKVFEKIDTEDPIKNQFWTQIIIRTINDKEGEMNDLVKKNLKIILSEKLLDKIKAKVFNVPGFINFMRYQINYGQDINYQQLFPNSTHFTFTSPKAQKIFRAQNEASYRMFLSDIAIFYMFSQQNERLKGKNTTELFDDIGKYLLQRAGTKTLKQFFERIKGSDLLLQQYHGLSFFFEFIRVFHLFDNERFDKTEASIQNIGTLFWKLYKFSMILRVRIKKDIADPIAYAIKNIRMCAEKTYAREGQMNFNRAEALCQEDYSDYIKMELFLKYYVYNNDPTPENKKAFFNFNLRNFANSNEKFMIVESSSFHKFMDTVQPGQINFNQLCNGYEQEDLCIEAAMRKEFILILQNSPIEWQMINDKILQPYSQILAERKYLFWNLMEIVERLDNFKFEQFLRRLDDEGIEKAEHNSFVEYLYIDESEIETWVAQYLRLNFSHYALYLENLAQTVDYIMNNEDLEKYLTHGQEFTYNGEHDVIRQFHFANVRLFLYLAHKKQNYSKLAHFLKNHTWMVILFKKMTDKDQDQFIKDLSEHIKSSTEPQENAKLVLQYINKKYQDIQPHSITEQGVFNGSDAYDFLGENMEDDLDDLEDFEDEQEFVDFVQNKDQPAATAQFQDYLKDKFMKEIKANVENKKARNSLRSINQKVYKEVLDADKGSLMDVLKKVFDFVKEKTGKDEITQNDMEHVDSVLSTNANIEHSQQLRQVFEDALKEGNVITLQNIQVEEIQNNDERLLI